MRWLRVAAALGLVIGGLVGCTDGVELPGEPGAHDFDAHGKHGDSVGGVKDGDGDDSNVTREVLRLSALPDVRHIENTEDVYMVRIPGRGRTDTHLEYRAIAGAGSMVNMGISPVAEGDPQAAYQFFLAFADNPGKAELGPADNFVAIVPHVGWYAANEVVQGDRKAAWAKIEPAIEIVKVIPRE